jgi:hypothetical protein
MIYTKEPKARSFPTPEELFEQTEKDSVRSKLLGKFRIKELKNFEGIVFIDPEMTKDLENNGPVLSRLFYEGKSFCRIHNGFRDVNAKAVFSNDKKTYTVIVTDINGKQLNEANNSYLLNFETHPDIAEKEIQIKWFAIDDKSGVAFAAGYENVFSKLARKVKELKWKN